MGALIKTTRADRYFSLMVRMRANYTCENCGIQYDQTQAHMLDSAHVFSREYKMTRHHSKNALCLCHSCHRGNQTRNPLTARETQELAKKVFGIAVFEKIESLRRELYRKTDHDIKDVTKWLRIEWHRVSELKKQDYTRRIEFRGYPA